MSRLCTTEADPSLCPGCKSDHPMILYSCFYCNMVICSRCFYRSKKNIDGIYRQIINCQRCRSDRQRQETLRRKIRADNPTIWDKCVRVLFVPVFMLAILVNVTLYWKLVEKQEKKTLFE
jgi:hypothetical protein